MIASLAVTMQSLSMTAAHRPAVTSATKPTVGYCFRSACRVPTRSAAGIGHAGGFCGGDPLMASMLAQLGQGRAMVSKVCPWRACSGLLG